MLIFGAALVSGRRIDRVAILVAESFIFVVTLLGMQLNVLTDRELDREAKPHLARWLTSAPGTLRWVIVCELGAAFVLLCAVVAIGRSWLFSALFVAAALFNLYSYNVLVPHRAAELRLKVFWWGHALVGIGGYFTLWMAGFFCATNALPDVNWLVLAVAASSADYGTFLVESAEDAPEESAFAMKTLPALVGRKWTIAIASALIVVGSSGVLWAALRVHRATRLALVWLVAVQAIAAIAALVSATGGARSRSRSEKRPSWRWEKVVDATFLLARLGLVSILLTSRHSS